VRLLWQKKEWRNRYLLWSVYDQKAAEEAKKSEAEAVVKKLLAGGMSADEILEKLK
jgi:hypothetical protein